MLIRNFTIAALALTATLGFSITHVIAAEKTGSTTSDAPNLKGQFVLHNDTTVTRHYQIKWGNGEWKKYTLEPGYETAHSYPLDKNGRAPSPYIRLDSKADDNKVTWKDYHLHFGKVGYAGYGPKGNIDEALHYEFTTSGKVLDLVKR
jgi:hypothetical protein